MHQTLALVKGFLGIVNNSFAKGKNLC